MNAVHSIADPDPLPSRQPVDIDADWRHGPDTFASRPAYEREAWRPVPTYEPRVWVDPAPTLRAWVWRTLTRSGR